MLCFWHVRSGVWDSGSSCSVARRVLAWASASMLSRPWSRWPPRLRRNPPPIRCRAQCRSYPLSPSPPVVVARGIRLSLAVSIVTLQAGSRPTPPVPTRCLPCLSSEKQGTRQEASLCLYDLEPKIARPFWYRIQDIFHAATSYSKSMQ